MKRYSLKHGLFCVVMSAVCLFAAVFGAGAVPGKELPATAVQSEEAPVARLVSCILRFKPSAKGKNVGMLADGTAVNVVGNAGDYYEIDCYGMTAHILKSQVTLQDGVYRVTCDPQSGDTVMKDYTSHAEALELRHSLLALAKEQLGKPYIYGSTGTRGFDCSGLMYYLYGKHGITLNRTASQQLADGVAVAREGMQVGDLVFFREPGESYPASHVGIYAGNNTVIHAGNRGVEWVKLEGEYFNDCFLGARRVICTGTASMEQAPVARMGRSAMPAGGVSGRTVNG